jgi:hypothetical protein
LIAACLLPRLASTCAGVVGAERAIGVVVSSSPVSSSMAPPSPWARLLDASDGALARGVRPGQRIVDAQRHAPDLQVVVVDGAVLVTALHGVAELFYRHAPACEPLVPADRVSLPFFAIVVDLAGMPRSPARLLAGLAHEASQAGHRAVIASSSSRAWSLAVATDMAARPMRWGRALLVVNDRGPERLAARARLRAQVAVESLGIDRDVVDDLRAAGITTAQDLVPLLPHGLVERLGASTRHVTRLLVDADDDADIDDVVTPWRPPEQVNAVRDLEDAVTTLQPLLFLLRPLVQDVLRRLEARGDRLLELAVALRRRGAPAIELAVVFPAATAAVDVVVRVLHARLERAFAEQCLGEDGIRGIGLCATRTTAAQARQLDVLSPSSSSSSSPPTAGEATLARSSPELHGPLAALCAELWAEFGDGRVGCLRPTRAPLPEHMTALQWPPAAVDDDDDRIAGRTVTPRRRSRPVAIDPRTAHGRFTVGWPWPLSMLSAPLRLPSDVVLVHEQLLCRLDGTDVRGPYDREYRVVVFADGRRALCVWDTELAERWLWGWFD